MLRRAIVFGLLLGAFPALAQQDSVKLSRISIGVSGGPDHCFRTLADNGGNPFAGLIIDLRNDLEIPRVGHSIGADILFHLSEQWSVVSGVRYSDQGYRTEEITSFATVDMPEGDPAIPLKGIQSVYHYRYLSVPVVGQFRPGKGRLRFASALGVSADFLLTATETVRKRWEDDLERESKSLDRENYNPVSLSGRAELGGTYRVVRRLELCAAIVGLYQLTKLTDTPITGYLWSVGVQCGIRYRL
ncbi:MAG: PorT family protein [Flavobacteriales bacterium]|nr:PorT family protein [Flavobacteriales bacterium]